MLQGSKLDHFLLSVIKGCVLLTLFIPLLVVDQLLFPFVFPRTILFRILIEIGIACWVILALRNSDYRLRRPSLLVMFGAFILSMIISSAFGANWHHSFWSSFERGEGILTWIHLYGWFMLLVSTIRDREDWLELFKTMVLSGILQTIYALGEFFKFTFAVDTSGIRVSGAIGNPSFLAPYLIAVIASAGLLVAQSKSKLWRSIAFVLIAADLFVIWETQTRGAILGCFLGFVIVALLLLWRRYHTRGIVMGGIILLLFTSTGVIVARSFNLTPLIKGAPIVYRLLTTSLDDITTQNRFIVWGAGWHGFLERPILGWGWENFSEPFNAYFDPALTRDIGSHPWYDRAHNTLLEVGVATGAIGLLIYLLLWGATIYVLWNKKTTLPYQERLLLSWFFMAYFVQNLFVFDTLNSYLMWVLLLAYLQSQRIHARRSGTARSLPHMKKLAAVLGVLLLFSLYYLNIRPVFANYYTVEASIRSKGDPEQAQRFFARAFEYSPATEEEPRFILAQYTRDSINRIGITDATKPLISFAIAELQKTIDAHPAGIQTYLLLSEVYLAADTLDQQYIRQAETTALAALVRAPRRYQTYTLLGRIKAQQGDLPAAIKYLTQAVELNDRFAEAHWNLAIAYILSRDQEKANLALSRVEELGFPVYDDKNIRKLVNAYADARDLTAIIAFMDRVLAHVPDNPQYQQLSDELKKVRDEALASVKENKKQ